MAEQYKNFAASTLAASMDNSTDPITFSVAAGQGTLFPATTNGSFRIVIDSEVLLVTSRSTDAFTAARAQEGSTIAAHSSAAAVTGVLTAGAMDQIRQDLSRTGTGALPTTGRQGDLWLPGDDLHVWQHSGSAFVPWGPVAPCKAVVDGDYSWVNQGSASKATTNSSVFLTCVGESSYNWHLRVKSVPSAPYTATMGIAIVNTAATSGSAQFLCGMILRDSGTSKLIDFGPGADQQQFSAFAWTNSTTFSGTQKSVNSNSWTNQMIWLRIVDDNTNRIYKRSTDGINFVTFFSETRTTFITPDQIGFGICTSGLASTDSVGMTVFSYKES